MLHCTKYKIQNPSRLVLAGICLFLPFLKTNAQVLENYISEAQANSPKIEALRKAYGISKEKTEEVNSLPNTKISGGYFLSEAETRTGAQIAKFSIQQAIPWFGTISARQNYANSKAEVENTKIRIAQRKLTLAVSQSYFKLYALKAKQRVTDSIISLLHTYKQFALKAVEVDKASAVDVLQLQIRQNELSEQKAVLQSDFEVEKSRFSNLLNRKNQQKNLFIPDSLGLPTLRQAQRDTSISTLRSFGKLRTGATQRDKSISPEVSGSDSISTSANPELLQYDQMKSAIDESEKLNTKEAAPQLGFGVNYIAVSKRPNMNFSDNGKDIVMPMVSVSIPIFTHKYRSVSRQHALEKEKLNAQKKDRKNELQSALEESIQQQKAARVTFETQQKNLQQAKNAEQILLKSYETATLDFDDVLDIEALRLKIQLKQIEAVKNYYQQQVRIDYLKPHLTSPKGKN